MEQYLIKKSRLHGKIAIPPSKSQTMRAILFGALGKGKTIIHNYLSSPDTDKMLTACRYLGAKIDHAHQRIEIEGVNGNIPFVQDIIDAGNSGIILRFLTAIGSLAKLPVVITGDDSIKYKRPMSDLLSGLRQLGAKTFSMRGDDFAPLIIQGPINSGKTTLCGADSQPVSALLIAAAFNLGPTEIIVENPGEKPWVGVTLDWFDKLGIAYENQDFRSYKILGGSSYSGFEYEIPGDLSSAAFPIAAALVTKSEITLSNIDLDDPQGDKELIFLFQKMGANIEIDREKKELHIKKTNTLRGVQVDINDFIDSLPALAVTACFAEGETLIQNAAVARQKECDRLACMAQELKKMGADVQEKPDGLIIKNSKLNSAKLETYNDHRMVMALSAAALACEGETLISPVGSVKKTFPKFCEAFRQLGGEIREL